MAEIKRKNGYYYHKDKWLPSVSTIMKSGGDPAGLIRWACKQGGFGVIWGLSKIKDHASLTDRLASPSCIEWAAEQAIAGLESEGDRVKGFGTNVHAGIEARLTRTDIDVSNWTVDEKKALETFCRFYEDIGFDPYLIEDTVYSEEVGFAGRLDLVADLSPEQCEKLSTYLTKTSAKPSPGLYMSDFKTGSLYVRSQQVQLSAYSVALKETRGRDCVGGMLINIPREEPEKCKVHIVTKEDMDFAFTEGFLPTLKCWKYYDAPKWYHQQYKKEAA